MELKIDRVSKQLIALFCTNVKKEEEMTAEWN